MDAFEQIIARILERNHYWILQNFKVELSRQDKINVGLPTMPRPDIDIIAYDAKNNVVLWVECKSYMDSVGVKHSGFVVGSSDGNRYRVFTNANYRRVVTSRLLKQMHRDNFVPRKPRIEYWLVAGKFHKASREKLERLFAQRGWTLKGPDWVKEQLLTQVATSYTNDAVVMAAKLMTR